MEWPRTLEAENANLLLEIEELKKHTVPKATPLECEISMLSEEIESLKILLGIEDKASGEPPKPRPEKAEKGKSKFKVLK